MRRTHAPIGAVTVVCLLQLLTPGLAVADPSPGSPQDVAQLRADRRLALSGISDPRAGLSSLAEVEAYVGRDDLGALADDYFLDLDHRPDAPNVVLHVVESPLGEPPRLFSAADLFDRRGPREVRAGLEILRLP